MKQAKSIAFIGLAASLIVFAHYVGADEGGVIRAADQGLAALSEEARSVFPALGGMGEERPRAQAHRPAADLTGRRTRSQGTGCRLDFRADDMVARLFLIRLPATICN